MIKSDIRSVGKPILFLFFQITILFFSCSKSPEELKLKADKLFNQAADLYERGYYRQSEKYFLELSELDRELKNDQRIANVNVYLGLIRYNRGDFQKAKFYYYNAVSEFKKQLNKKGEALALNNIAGIHAFLGGIDSAQTIYKNVLSLSLLSADKEAEAIALVNLASLFTETSYLKKALDFYKKAFESYSLIDDQRGKIFVTNKIGLVHFLLGNPANALSSYEFALDLASKYSNNYLGVEIFNNIGLAYFSLNEFIKAEQSFETALEKNKMDEKNSFYDIVLKSNLGDCSYALHQFSKANELFLDALNSAEISSFKYLSPYLQIKIGECEEKLGEAFKAENHFIRAETFYQYASNRFEKQNNFDGLKFAAVKLINLYQKQSKIDKIKKLLKKIDELETNHDVRQKEWALFFARNFSEQDLLPVVYAYFEIGNNNKSFEELCRIKLKSIQSYFFKFKDFNFFGNDIAVSLDKLKHELFRYYSYEEMLIKELSLPRSQQDGDKIDMINDELENSRELIKEIKAGLHFQNPILNSVFFGERIRIQNILKPLDKSTNYLEFVPFEKELLAFLISDGLTNIYPIKISAEDFQFKIDELQRNFSRFSIDEHKEISNALFEEIFQSFKDKIFLKSKLKIVTNNFSINFLPHLLYVKEHHKFLNQIVDVHYTPILSKVSRSVSINSLIISGMKSSTLHKDEIKALQSTLENFDMLEQIDKATKIYDNIFILSDFIMNSHSPNIDFGEMNTSAQNKMSEDLTLHNLLILKPKNIYFSEYFGNGLISVQLLSSMLIISGGESIVLTLNKKEKDSSINFLYNYASGMSKNNSENSFSSAIRSMIESKKFPHQKFWGNYLIFSN